ncbi:MAG: pyridoxamine 5'-phosphate oxidase [Epsilonproteobacteria bacterium]|nr:pyridoxamine 5'-phosphate oxidase [Campylobacterota bacterium]
MDLTSLRQQYGSYSLRKRELDPNPLKQFELWFNQAMEAELIEPNAMTLATVNPQGRPSIRTVLLKIFDERGFVFFSNYKSKKAYDIEHNPNASLHFAWLGLERQVKIQGKVEKISHAESLKYFLSRPKGSQIGAWVSHQSEVISTRSILESKFQELKAKFAQGEVPFPSFWGGYRLVPDVIEFWQGGKDRLHDRFEYTKQADGTWDIKRLAP